MLTTIVCGFVHIHVKRCIIPEVCSPDFQQRCRALPIEQKDSLKIENLECCSQLIPVEPLPHAGFVIDHVRRLIVCFLHDTLGQPHGPQLLQPPAQPLPTTC
jgi:hypothetical protein